MDGDITQVEPLSRAHPETAHPETSHPETGAATGRPTHTVRWFVIVGLLIALVLGGLYGFNTFRAHAIANFFASNKPPAAEVSAVVAQTETVPHFAPGIGSLAAVQQVTISPEVGGRVVAILFKSGTEIKSGDPLVQINDAPDKGDLANFQAQARLATVTLRRAQTLAAKQYETQANVDAAQAQIDEANAQIVKTEAVIAQKQIRAPFDGKLGVRQIDLGQYLNAGAPVVSLTDLKHLYVNFTLPSSQIAEIKPGQTVVVTADAFPGRKFEATITTIEPQISASTRTVSVQATLPNPDEALMPGMFVNAEVMLPTDAPQVVLPQTAVDYTLYGDSVYVIRADGKDAAGKSVLKAYRTPVKAGDKWGDKVAILDGVKAGDQVVAAGQLKVLNGGAVTVTGNPPPAPPEHPTPQ